MGRHWPGSLPPPTAPGTQRGPTAAMAWTGPGRPGLSQGRAPPLRAFPPLCRLLRAALGLGSARPALIGGASCGSSRLAVAVPAGEGSGLKGGSAVAEGGGCHGGGLAQRLRGLRCQALGGLRGCPHAQHRELTLEALGNSLPQLSYQPVFIV